MTDARGTARQEYSPTSRTATDRLGVPKTLVYDVRDRLTEVVEYAGSGTTYRTRYEYSPLGRLSRYTDSLGNTRTLTYDGLGRMTKLTDLAPSNVSNVPSKSYSYDELGNLIQETDQENHLKQYVYDELSRPVEARFVRADGVMDRKDTYEYDL